MTQLAFDLAHRPALGREDFLVAPCNAEAVAWLDRWPDWPAPALTIHGPAGCGKTHLAQVWRARSGAIALGGASLDVGRLPSTLGDAQAAILEDADAQVRDEEALLHLYNMLAERRGHLLLSARTPPARWPLKLADLRSRLVAAPAVAVALPDETLIAALLVKLFADRQLRVSADLVDYLVPRLERSFEAVLTLVAALDAAALEGQRAVTVPLARKVMDGIAEREGKR